TLFRSPYMIHMPEKERLLLLVNWGKKPRNKSGVARSDDGGRTWKKPRLVTDAWSVGLTYLGAGNAVFLSQKSVTGPSDRYRFSRDFGQSWPDELPAPGYTDGKPFYEDSQFLVDRDSRTGKIVRLWATGKAPGQACLFRSTTDRGRTWSKYRHVPQWGRTGEIVLHRAANGNLVAACRANIPRFVDGKIDHWSGLGVSLSSDNGKTWSKLNILYAWGRHLSSMVTLPNGHIALTYVVRKGYVETTDGFPQFGIEAVVSRDHGRTWDLDHRYLLATWKGDQKGPGRWHASGQRTSTVLLPDGTLVTAFGAWYRNIVLVRWRIHRQRLSPGSTIADAAYDSKTRNVFAPKISRYARTDPGEKK
ncbi:MAG: sialidase family protein, partial [Planctomycetaceae bacterium]